MCYPKEATDCLGNGLRRRRRVKSAKYYSNIKQEVIDCLIASRSAYELSREGVELVLNRNDYKLDVSRFDLLFRAESSPIPSLPQKQLFVMVRSSAGYIMVACRGTFSLSDVIADFKVVKCPVAFAEGSAQAGFMERAMNMPLELFVSLLKAGESLIFTGHSLGGAVSSLAALRVLEAMASIPGHGSIAQEQVRCITFGTAPFANLELAAYVNSKYRNNFHNVVSKHDMVPRAHTLLPRVFFPAAKWLVDEMRNRWEVKACKSLIETLTKMSVDKAVMKLEEKVPSLWPATWFYKFLKECAAGNEALGYFHVGYLLMLDPDSDDPKSMIIEDEMERLSLDVCLENKSPREVYYEHGLGNHYSCLVRALSVMDAANDLSRYPPSIFQQSSLLQDEYFGMSCCPEQSKCDMFASAKEFCSRTAFPAQQPVKNPFRAGLIHLNRFLLRLTGNDFP